MTEEEARTKWCPFVRLSIAANPGVAFNIWSGDDGDPMRATCIASQCMAWRWDFTGSSLAHHEGYCGLAGPNPS